MSELFSLAGLASQVLSDLYWHYPCAKFRWASFSGYEMIGIRRGGKDPFLVILSDQKRLDKTKENKKHSNFLLDFVAFQLLIAVLTG